MSTAITQNRDQLRKRVQRFLCSSAHARREVHQTLMALTEFGRVLVFGGALRDLAVHGNREFPSDIDVVLEAADLESISAFMDSKNALQNKFGGYRFNTDNWKFDVWRLEDTWALKEGHVSGYTVESLLRTTFFNWDAIAYDFSKGRLLVGEGFFDALQAGVVDINLEPNPNPVGLTKRALKIYWSGTAGLAPRLAHFVFNTLVNDVSTEAEREMIARNAVRARFMKDFEFAAGGVVRRDTQQLTFA